ncbi:MAG TPA: ribosome biogenesis/translation initiation ATPase RLI [Candidatus Altiarchaeales archaeon]|nr:ribosome biogenesis/translation initiation ATPase RLI [Candidatus Altiarchaeales archaeon]
MRIAVLDREHCKPKDCNYKCFRICPINKTGGEAITIDEASKKPVISEILCTGCGICPKKCPYGAIHIINLPEELENPVHQYGVNGFRLYNIPVPRAGVVGLVGSNGVGKTTALKILAGQIKPNLGKDEAGWDEILEYYRGDEIQEYFQKLSEANVKAVYKPQYVESIPRHVSGSVKDILVKADERGKLQEIIETLNLSHILEREVKVLSGGELQRFAIAACLLRDADIYLIDEPGSYLDVRERMNVAKAIRALGDKRIIVVEHDLVMLDYLSDNIHVFFGEVGAYGIVSNIMGVRNGINEYLSGFLKSENMRFRDQITFDVRPPAETTHTENLIEYDDFSVDLDGFRLGAEAGVIQSPEIIGVLGPNATGKTTFVKVLDGLLESKPKLELDLEVSYKPQYVQPEDVTVMELGLKNELVAAFSLLTLFDRKMSELSGGELQRVAVSKCLSKNADVYLLDEPSAYLDVEQRLALAKLLKRFAYENKKAVIVVDHDVLLIDYLSNKIMVFDGEPAVKCVAHNPKDLRDGMNHFLREIDVTFRRDPETGRPRANKPASVKDREQKETGQYYYR